MADRLRRVLEGSEMYCSLKYESSKGIRAHDEPGAVEVVIMLAAGFAVGLFFIVLGNMA